MLENVVSCDDVQIKCSFTTFCSPYRNFDFSEIKKLAQIGAKKEKCGTKSKVFIDSLTSESVDFPVYCDNRSCSQEGCREHRRYKFRKEHDDQIHALNSSMEHPRAWIFTGWKVRIDELSKEFCREKLRDLYHILMCFMTSGFSIHMEIKVQDKSYAYLHFHVVSAYIKRIRLVRYLWGRAVFNEKAIKKEQLARYVSKYASKTPFFPNQSCEDFYTLLVYKTQMHRFSPKIERGEVDDIFDCENRTREKSLVLSNRVAWDDLYRDNSVDADNVYVRPDPPPKPLVVVNTLMHKSVVPMEYYFPELEKIPKKEWYKYLPRGCEH